MDEKDLAIRVSHLGKKYKIGTKQPYLTFADAIKETLTSPFQKITGNSKPRVNEEFWALKDVSFDVMQGEVVGIIGRNGAGKSTLLKILSRITTPTEGEVEIHGRVGSLLEVGTGFHPEMTGRENIFLNGSILGMKKVEIEQKFDDIIKFAEIEKFVDTPVKRYSSGMYVRLAFAVAAHLEPEILLVDEVLAVGDAQFQKKCLGKMGDVAKEGRTVLFVSHNMGAINRLCSKSIWIEKGDLVFEGSTQEVITSYLTQNYQQNNIIDLPQDSQKAMCLRSIKVLNKDRKPADRVEINDPFTIQLKYDINYPVSSAHVICFISTIEGVIILGTGDADCSPERLEKRECGTYYGECVIPGNLLGEGTYSITVSLGVPYVQVYDRHASIFSFEIFDHTSRRRIWQHQRRPGILGLELPWQLKKIV